MTTHSVFASTACLPNSEPLKSRVALYRSHGLQAIELGAHVSVHKDRLTQVANTDCSFLIHNYFPPPVEPFVLNLASSDQTVCKRSLSLVSEALVLSKRLGAPFYSVHAGFITDPTGFGTTSFIFPMPELSNETQRAKERFIDALNVALEEATRLDLQLLIENNVCSPELRGKLLLQTAAEFLELFEAMSTPHLGILLDTGHLNVTAHTLGFDPFDFVDQVAPYVRALHVHDNDGTADTHQPVQPKSWVLEVLRRPEFAPLPIVVEAKFDSVTELRQHVDWLKEELGRE